MQRLGRIAAAAVFVLAGCVTFEVLPPPEGEGGSGGTGATGGMGGEGGAGGSEPKLPYCTGGETVVLAAQQILLGDTKLDGTPDPTNGWREFGMNLDGLISTKQSTDLCKPANGGSPAAVYPDGLEGRDNAYGKNVLPIMLGLASDLSTQMNEEIASGHYSVLLKIESYAPGQACRTAAKIYLAGKRANPPVWDGTDSWPQDAEFLQTAQSDYPEAELQGSKLLGVTGASLDLRLPSKDNLLFTVLPLRHAQIDVDLLPDAQGATVMLGAWMSREELVSEISKIAANFDASFCDPNSPTLQSILNQIRQASDMNMSGVHDPAAECDAISIGLAFKMKRAKLGPVAPPAKPPFDPCNICYESCADASSNPINDPSVQFCPTTEGMQAQNYYDSLNKCVCLDGCASSCGGDVCLGGTASMTCTNCVTTMCMMEFNACANDL